MKRFVFCAILATVAAVGCDKAGFDDDQSSEGARELRQVVISATADSRETKTSVDEAGKVYWSPSDHLGVFFFKELYQFTSINNEQASSADFVGNVAIVGGTNEGFESSRDGYSYWAVYPYNSDAVCDGSSVTTTLSGKQYAKAGTFSDDTFLSVSRSTDYSQFNFHNVSGGLCFSVTGEDIQTVKFRGNNGETLAGTVKIAYNEDGVPVVTDVVSGVTEIVLNAPYGETFEPGEMYYLTALPAVLSEGFTMTFCQSNSSMVAERVVNASVTIRRNVFGRLTNADSGLEYVDSGVYNTVYPHPANNQVYYKTTNNRPLPLNWRAQSGNALQSNKYNSELGYCVLTFKDEVLSITGCASQAESIAQNLTELILPDSVLQVDDSAFDGCGNLSVVVLQEGLRKIYSSAFESTGLESIDLPHSLSFIGSYAFAGCPFNTIVNVPNANIMEDAFAWSTIPGVILGEGCQYVSGKAFFECNELWYAQIDNPDISVGTGIFEGCPLTSVSGSYFDTIVDCIVTEGCLSFVKPGVQVIDLTGRDVTSCIPKVFAKKSSITTIVAPDLNEVVNYNGELLFDGCTNLMIIYAPNLSYGGFDGCESLERVTMASLGYCSFVESTSLRYVAADNIDVYSGTFNTTDLDLSDCREVNLHEVSGIQNLTLPSITLGQRAISDVKSLTIMGDVTFEACCFFESTVESITIKNGDLTINGGIGEYSPELVFDEGYGISSLADNSIGWTTYTTLHLEKCDVVPTGNFPQTLENLYLKPGAEVYGPMPSELSEDHRLNIYVNGDEPIVPEDINWGDVSDYVSVFIPSTAWTAWRNSRWFFGQQKWYSLQYYDIETGESLWSF